MAAYTNALYTRARAHSVQQCTAWRNRTSRSRNAFTYRDFTGNQVVVSFAGEIGDVCFACSTFFFPVLHFLYFLLPLPLFYLSGLVFFPFFFFFFASVPHITINNLSKAVNREIDRRSSRKLLLRCIRLKVLFIRVSRNLFVRGTCFRRTMQSRLTRAEIPPRKLNKSRRRRAGCGGGKN